MTEIEKRLISEMLNLSLESRSQLVEILTQSLEQNYNDSLKDVLREIREDES